MLQSCLQLKCDIENIEDRLDREKWIIEWKKKKDGEKDVATVITGTNILVVTWENVLYVRGLVEEAYLMEFSLVLHQNICCYIATDKAFFHPKNADIFLISPQKHMLWVLIRSASVRHF